MFRLIFTSGNGPQNRLQIPAVLVPQLVALGAKRHQIVQRVGTAPQARLEVVNVQMPGMVAPLAPALVTIPGKDFAPGLGRHD